MLCETKKCSGCAACANSCPEVCISMLQDDFGFLYPSVDQSVCLQCGKCQSACPVLNPLTVHDSVVAYAAMEKSKKARLTASSGGAFELLAGWVLKQGGLVFGASYDEALAVQHICVSDYADLEKLKDTKYSQSRIGDTYKQAKKELEAGKQVLFSGTACQIAGLKSFLGKEYPNLLCVDLICHGVPSPAVWQHYLDYRAQKDNSGIRPVTVNQRSKATGWPVYSVEFKYDGHTECNYASQDSYMRGFIDNLYLRSSCYNCSFKGLHRAADFTLGDYWGIESQLPQMHDGKGTSLVLLHSEKAKQVWDDIGRQMSCKQIDPEMALRDNTMALVSAVYNPKADEFVARWKNEDFDDLVWSLVPKPPVPQKPGGVQTLKEKAWRIAHKMGLK